MATTHTILLETSTLTPAGIIAEMDRVGDMDAVRRLLASQSGASNGKTDAFELPAGFYTHTVTLESTEPAWPTSGAITLEAYIPETDTYLPGITINTTTPLPVTHELPISPRPHPLTIEIRAKGHSGEPVALTVTVDSKPV